MDWMRRKKETRKEIADALNPENNPCRVVTNRRYHNLAAAQPQSYPCSRQATPSRAEVAIWAATLAPSQAGATKYSAPFGEQSSHPCPSYVLS